MTLLEQSPWWILPYILLILLMVHAMMEFTVSLLVERPPRVRQPASAADLRGRLLALDQSDQAYPLVEGSDCDLEITWEIESSHPPSRIAVFKSASRGRLRFLLDEPPHELRMNLVTYSYYFFAGFSGWLPRLSGYAGFQSGLPGASMPREISKVALRSGWTVRPVLWWFQATHKGFRTLKAITPAPLRRLPARRFWGVLYPLSYILGMAYLAFILGPLQNSGWLLMLGISAAWWGIWGFLVWMLLGFPR